MDTAEIIHLFEVAMCDFDADCIEEETARSYAVPNIIQIEVGENLNPEFCWENGETQVSG
jgi:hypothetical protein